MKPFLPLSFLSPSSFLKKHVLDLFLILASYPVFPSPIDLSFEMCFIYPLLNIFTSFPFSFLCFFFFFFFFRATLAAYGDSQARGWIGAVAAGLQHSPATAIPDQSHVCNLHHSSRQLGSLTQWLRPGIKPASSWILVRFVFDEPKTGTLSFPFSFRTAFSKCHFHLEQPYMQGWYMMI